MPSPKTTKSKPQTAGAAAATTSDDFLGGRITVLQPQKGHRSGSDAIWLQAAVPAKKGESVLDAGWGTPDITTTGSTECSTVQLGGEIARRVLSEG